MKVNFWSVIFMLLSLAGCGANSTGDNGAATPPPYTVSGTISAITQPSDGFKVELTDGANIVSTQADGKGNYSFTGLVSASYAVKPTHANYTFDPVETVVSNITRDQVVNFTANVGNPHPATHTVSGTITLPNPPPSSSVTVQITTVSTGVNSSVPANADGTYLISGVETGGTYTVKPIHPSYTFTPDVSTITNLQSDKVLNFTASAIPAGYSISGRITQNNTALAGVNLTLKNTTTAAEIIGKPTDNNGNYSFGGLASGTYTVAPSLTGVTFTPSVSPPLTVNGSNITQNFTAQAPTPGVVTRNYTLYIQPGTLTINGNAGTSPAKLAAWGFTDVDGGLPKFPGPQLSANEGDTVNVTVINNHNIAHNFVIQGATSGTPILINPNPNTVKYTFTAVNAGSYLYYDSLNADVNREMGLYGALIVGPPDGSLKAWNNGPDYTFQRIWILSEMDKLRWNDVASAGSPVSTSIYKPNYFLINGQGGSDGMTNTATTIEGNVGETALVRIINAGQFTNSLHFHGNHVQVLTVNGVRQASPYKELDVISIPPMGTAEVLYKLNQKGEYPMHNHISQMETANGVYLNGIVTMIIMHQ